MMKGGGDLDRVAVDLGGKASRRPGPGLHQLGRPRGGHRHLVELSARHQRARSRLRGVAGNGDSGLPACGADRAGLRPADNCPHLARKGLGRSHVADLEGSGNDADQAASQKDDHQTGARHEQVRPLSSSDAE